MSPSAPRKALCLLILTSLFAPLGAALPLQEDTGFAPTMAQVRTTREILDRLMLEHYEKVDIDDELSERFLDSYVETLDPTRFYFFAKDVDSFRKYRHRFDDALSQGKLEPAYEIFNRFQERRVERWEHMNELLKNELDGLRFDEEETFQLDRTEVPWPETSAEMDALWFKRFKNDVLNLRLADRKSDEIQEVLDRRYADQLRRVKQVNGDDAYRICMNVLTRSYDPHTEYYPPRDAENFDIAMSLKVHGIGALLGSEGEYTAISRIIPGGPAASSPLKAGDRIIGVAQGNDDPVDIIGWRVDEAVDLIRGPKGSVVRLLVLPADVNDVAAATTIEIVRDEVKLEEQSAQSQIVEVAGSDPKVRIGVIELPAFYVDFDAIRRGREDYRSSTRDVFELVRDLKKEKVDGIILDLRNNGGGSLTEVIGLVSLFIGGGPVVQVQTMTGATQTERGPTGRPYYDGPLGVVINRLSASASEIFAGAIQDYGRGVVMGSRSFGKGTVQQLIPIGRGQLKLTQAKFYRISGESTQHRGVVPDIEFPSLYDPEDVGESSLDGALPWDRIKGVPFNRDDRVSTVLPSLKSAHQKHIAEDPEFQNVVRRLRYSEALGRNTRVSLKEESRRAEREGDNTMLLELENRYRKETGQEPVEKLSDIERSEDEKDPYAQEAARILRDFIIMSKTVMKDEGSRKLKRNG